MINLTDSQVEDVRRAAINGEYHLMLGAGASRQTSSRGGDLLPGSNDLAKLFADQFSVNFEDGDLLWRVYDRAVTTAGQKEVYNWLRTMFFDTAPPDWMDQYARFPWHTVWTLNIDDGFEKAYARVATEYSRRMATMSWDDESVSRNRDLPVIHLHGHVLAPDPRALVFSLAEYQDAVVSRAAWPLIFRDTYGVSPFVIIGARLRDEPDIEKVIARRTPAQAAPSFYISPTISDAVAEDLVNWNLIPVRATAEEFLTDWKTLTQIDLDLEPSRVEEIGLRFGRQFRELTTNKPGKVPANHDFIGGDEPRWPDIVEGRYAEVDWIRLGRSTVGRFGKDIIPSSMLVYSGRRLAGRSTGLLGLAKVFRQNAWRVFLFTADERIDVDAVLQFASDGRAVVLVIDGVADIAEDVQEILEKARRSRLRVACLAVDHPDRSAGILGRIAPNLLVDQGIKSINGLLTRTDSARLVDHLQKAGRLGMLEGRSDRDRLRYFTGQGIFAALGGVEDAPGFGSRVGTLTADLDDTAEIHLCLFAAIASRVDRTLLVIDAARMLEVDSDEVVRLAKRPAAAELIWSDGQRILTRHRWMALNHLLDKIGSTNALDILSRALVRLAGRANRAAHRERNSTTMFVGSMMIYRNLVDIFPSEDLGSWYQRLEGSFGYWSGRYWEQRAILNRHLGQDNDAALARAESFAQRAVTLVKDPYSYTTLGTILAARASVADRTRIQEYYDRAYDAFEKSSEIDPRNLVTWIAYLRHTLPVLQRIAVDEVVDELEERLFDDWLGIFGQIYSVASGSEATKQDLDRIRRRFDMIELTRDADVSGQEAQDVADSDLDSEGLA